MDELGTLEFDWFLNNFAPAIITAGQWTDLHRSDALNRPFRNLHIAVIEQFLRDYRLPPIGWSCDPLVRAYRIKCSRFDDRLWVEMPGEGPFSFDSCCAMLGIDPTYLRRGMRRFMRLVDRGTPPKVNRHHRRGDGMNPVGFRTERVPLRRYRRRMA